MQRDQVAPHGAVIIRLAGVTKRFGAHIAVDDLSLDLREGEFFCLLGPSGCGKSTALRLLAGFEQPDGGSLTLDGRDLVGVPPHRRPLNMMFQHYALFPHMTVGGNVAYGVKLAGLRRAEVAARVGEMLRLVRLDGLADRYPAQLSGGQRQRVALARALARRPRVLLLDEPMAALDRNLREQTQAELKGLQRRLGTTFVVVTHDQGEAMTMADRIGVMEAGRLVQIGSPREIYDRPRTRFVARFVGETNLLDGTVAGRDGDLVRIALAEGPTLTARGAAELPVGSPAALAVRPERLVIGPSEGARPDDLAGTVEAVEFAGPSIEYRVRLGGGALVLVSRPNDGAEAALAPGAAVGVAVRPGSGTVLP